MMTRSLLVFLLVACNGARPSSQSATPQARAANPNASLASAKETSRAPIATPAGSHTYDQLTGALAGIDDPMPTNEELDQRWTAPGELLLRATRDPALRPVQRNRARTLLGYYPGVGLGFLVDELATSAEGPNGQAAALKGLRMMPSSVRAEHTEAISALTTHTVPGVAVSAVYALDGIPGAVATLQQLSESGPAYVRTHAATVLTTTR
jgi:hypothetical protein